MADLKFGDYGQLRDIDATPEELEIFDIIKGINNDIELVRKTGKYVTALLGETDVARFKYTSRAKWIQFPCTAGKIKLDSVADVEDMENEITDAINKAIEINNY